MKNEVIKKYIPYLDELLKEINETHDLRDIEAQKRGHEMLIFLFGRLFKYTIFDSIYIRHETKGDMDATAWTIEGQEYIIEFEVLSSQFDHPPEKCNLIVCWEDNWKKCPLNIDVLELKYFWELAKSKRLDSVVI